MYAPQTASYEELEAKVRRTCDIFKTETSNGRNAAAVVLHRLSNNYNETLNQAQYLQLLGYVEPLIDETDDKGLQQLLGHTCYTLYRKSDAFNQSPKAWRQAIKELSMTWTNLMAPENWDAATVMAFDLHSLPETVLTGPDATILATPRSQKDMEYELKELFDIQR